jgi:hypothetical protein
MPSNSVSGNRLISVPVAGLATYYYAPTDGVAEVSAVPGGGGGTTLVLPSNPSSGDWYAFADEDGSCGAASPIVLEAAAGTTVAGAASLSSSTPRSAAVAIFDADSKNWAVFSSAPGGASGSEIVVLPFSFATASPLAVSPLAAGSSVLDAKVLITTPFNGGGGPSLALGPTASPDEIFAPGDVDVALAASYENPAVFVTAAADTLVLTIVAGGSTAGAGVVVAIVKL